MRLPHFILKLLLVRVHRYMAMHQRDVIIWSNGAHYLYLWYVHPRSARRTDPTDTNYHTIKGNRLGIYIHRFLQSDYEEVLHDHPRHNISIVLERGFWEHIKGKRLWRAPGTIIFRKATTPHRIELEYNSGVPRYSHEALSLFISGPRIREWGFHCPKGWVDQRTFTNPDGSRRGCQE